MYFFYYIPVGLDIGKRPRSIITYFLAGLCVTVFICYKYEPISQFWNVTNLIFLPAAPNLFTAISYAFLHGGYFHLIGNIVYLVVFGRAVEDRFGPVRFAAIFTVSAVVGAYIHLFYARVFSPADLMYGVVGASGATSGLLGSFLVRFYFSRIEVAYWIFMPLQGVNRAGRTHVPAVFAILFWVLLQVVHSLLHFGGGVSGIAYCLHIGGFAAGVGLSVLFGALSAARAEHHLSRARRFFRESNWFGAQGEYLNYLAKRDDEAAVHAETARAFICGSQPDRARYHYGRAARLFLQSGNRTFAEQILVEAMKIIPGFTVDERTHLDLAFGMERTLKFHAASTAYGNFVHEYPDSKDAPFVLLRMAGLFERRFCRRGDAYDCYRRLVEFHPEDTWVEYARSEMTRLEAENIGLL